MSVECDDPVDSETGEGCCPPTAKEIQKLVTIVQPEMFVGNFILHFVLI